MVSTPKESTTKVEPWDGAKDYLLEQYKLADELFKSGAPQAYQGSTIANQSNATLQALAGMERLAKNGDTSALTNANSALNSILKGSGVNNKSATTLSQLQKGIDLGTNPSDAYAKKIASGQTAKAPGQFDQKFTNPALAQAAGLGSFTNDAVGQAQGLGSYTNSALGLQAAQAQQLAAANNPALAYLQNTASGANIGNNPYLDAMVGQQQDKIAEKLKNVTNPGIDSQAASLGRMGSAAFATQRNNAESAAANEMAKVATDMYGNQYNQDVANQMAAAGQYGNFYNQDVANQMNANQALANSDNAQQQNRLAGTQLYGNLIDSQQQQRLAGTQLYGNLADSQQQQRLNAANYANQQFNADRDYQMQGVNLLANNYQNNIQNMLASNDQRLNAANSMINAQQNANAQKLQAVGMAGDVYQNQYLPYQMLAQVGQQRDARNDAELAAQINAWDRAQQQPIQNVSNFINMLNSGGYSNTTTPVYSNTGGQVLGGLSSLAGLFALCDVGEKILHKFLGFMPLLNGETVAMYEFSYVNDPDDNHYVGPIAQEVEEKIDGAVIEFEGKKLVNVERLIQEAA